MRWLDLAYLRIFPRRRCFPDGWGDEDVLHAGLDHAWCVDEPEVPEIRWTRTRVHGAARIRDGALVTDNPELPLESRHLRVRLLEPREGEARGLVVVLASWSDEDSRQRMKLVGDVVRAGLAVLIPETPFYGARRRVGQRGANLRYASDFVAMGRATIQEARALLAWGRRRYPSVGVAGYSMGGQMAAYTASLVPWPVRAVCVATASSPARVFFDGPLHEDVRRAPLGEGGLDRLRVIMEGLSVLDLPPPKEPVEAVLVGTRGDVIVPPGDTGAIARHWGVHPRWIDDGHISTVLRRSHAMAQAVIDAFA